MRDVNGAASITPVAALPAISDSSGGTTIDGTTQTNNIGDTDANGLEVELDGTSAGGTASGLSVTAGSSMAIGLVIDGFGGYGVYLVTNGGTEITENLIINNSYDGVRVASGATSCKIYHNTIHANTGDGVEIQASGTIVKITS